MGRYDDIINLEYPISGRHSRMSAHDRAAQFSPFAALSGYNEIISETGKTTDTRPELDEEQLQHLNEMFSKILESLQSKPLVKGVCFVADTFREGGHTEVFSARVRNIDFAESALILSDGRSILFQDICELNICY